MTLAMLFALAVAAAPSRLDALPELRASPAPRLVPRARTPAPPGTMCRFEQHDLADARVPLLWSAQCFAAQAWTFGLDDGAVVVPLLRQQGVQTWLGLDAHTAVEFDRWRPPPAGVSKLAHQRAEELTAGAPPGFVRLGVDPRDGAVLGHSYDRGYLRLKHDPRLGAVQEPLFEGRLPPETQTPRVALVLDADPTVKAPWLVYAPDPWRNAELRVRAPSGAEEVLLRLPPRAQGGSYRVSTVKALRAGAQQRPIVTALVDGAHLLFTPAANGAWATRALQAVSPLPARPSPPGASPAPPCTEAQRLEDTEEHFDPQLFEHRGRAFIAYVVEDTRQVLRFGPVAREGATPADDRVACEWITDASAAERSLVIAEVGAGGQLQEHLRVALQQLGGSSVVALQLAGDRLHVVTGSMSLISWLVVDLARATLRR